MGSKSNRNADPHRNPATNPTRIPTLTISLALTRVTADPNGRPDDAGPTTIDTVVNDNFADVGVCSVPEHQPRVLWVGQGQGLGQG